MIKSESIKRGSITTSIYNILGKALNFISLFLASYFFGANRSTDIYYFTLSFIGLFILILFSVQSNVFMTIFLRTRLKKGEEEAWKLANSLITYSVLLSLIFSILFFIFATEIIKRVSNFSYEEIINQKNILYCFAPAIVLLLLVEFLRLFIQSYQQFTFPAKSVLFNGLSMIVMILCFHSFGIISMVIALIISYSLQAFLMIIYLKKRMPYFGINFSLRPEYKELFKLGLPVFVSQICGSIAAFYYDYRLSMFDGGTLTALGFAQRINSLPGDMIIMPLATVIAPFFSEFAARADFAALSDEYIKYNNLLWYVVIPISGIFIFYSNSISHLLFLRGSFTPDKANIISSSLRYYAISLFGISFSAVNSRLLFAIQKTKWISLISVITGIISIGLTYITTKYLGYIGVPVAKSLIIILLGIIPGIVLTKLYIKEMRIYKIIKSFVLFVFMTIVSIAICYFIRMILLMKIFEFDFSDSIYHLFRLIILLVFFPIVYLSISYLFKIKEFDYFFSLFKKKHHNLRSKA